MKDFSEITDIWKKAGLLGIGMWALTEEKFQDITDELIENGEMKKEEGKKFIRDLKDEHKKQKEEMENKISSKVQETMNKADIATKDEVRELKDIIQKLDAKLDKLTGSDDEEKDV
ncbi:hypothetical protein V7O67_14885 [Methanolobus sp. ZRKC4]|uniref:phasin family protein n=1 Tax=Methanolobus sp. ZRKC4 TaxID=3125787 RepID=UPI00324BE33E